MNASLLALMSPSAPPEHRAKLDAERARRMFLLYCGRLRRALTSPRCCFFSGFAAVGPRVIDHLKQQVGARAGTCCGSSTAAAAASLPPFFRICGRSSSSELQPSQDMHASPAPVCLKHLACFLNHRRTAGAPSWPIHSTPSAQVLGSFRLGTEGALLMGQLDLWTRCCEFSVAACVGDCLQEGLRHGLATRCGGAAGD
jgi:hypothetical protein